MVARVDGRDVKDSMDRGDLPLSYGSIILAIQIPHLKKTGLEIDVYKVQILALENIHFLKWPYFGYTLVDGRDVMGSMDRGDLPLCV